MLIASDYDGISSKYFQFFNKSKLDLYSIAKTWTSAILVSVKWGLSRIASIEGDYKAEF